MKSPHLFTICIVLLMGCQTQAEEQITVDKQAEIQKVEKTLLDFFDAIADYDYQRMRNITADNYVLIENGPLWTVDSLITMMKQFEEQATISYKFSDMETTVQGQTAWMTYKNNGVMNFGDRQQHFDWTESAVFSKQDNEWKMVLLHSTMNEPDSSQSDN